MLLVGFCLWFLFFHIPVPCGTEPDKSQRFSCRKPRQPYGWLCLQIDASETKHSHAHNGIDGPGADTFKPVIGRAGAGRRQWQAPSGTYPARWPRRMMAWKFELPGKGGSTRWVWQSRIYLTTTADGQDAVLALDAAGKQAGSSSLGQGKPRRNTQRSVRAANLSPVTDGKVFSPSSGRRLVALDSTATSDGKPIFQARFGPENLFWDPGQFSCHTDSMSLSPRMHMGNRGWRDSNKTTGSCAAAKAQLRHGVRKRQWLHHAVFFDYKARRPSCLGREH